MLTYIHTYIHTYIRLSPPQFFQRVEVWLDECQAKDYPQDIARGEEMLSRHEQLKEACHALYTGVRMEGHKIVEKLRTPIGDSSLPRGFVMGTRHVKEILESLFDEKNWIDEQWARRRVVLFQALNLRKFQEEAKKVGGWVWLRGSCDPREGTRVMYNYV